MCYYEVQVRLIRRFIGPGYLYEELDIERTDPEEIVSVAK
jgi:hypothetical protein